MDKTMLIGALVIVVVFLGVGIFIGMNIPRKVTTPYGNQEDSFQAGIEIAKQRLQQSPVGIVNPTGSETKTIMGTIQKIDGNKLTVKINSTDPLSDPNLDTRMINVDLNTNITLISQKDPVLLQKELQDFQDKMKNPQSQAEQSQDELLPPEPFNSKKIEATELKENQRISIIASENIKDKKEFLAIEVVAQEIPASVEYSVPDSVSTINAPISIPASDTSVPDNFPVPIMIKN